MKSIFLLFCIFSAATTFSQTVLKVAFPLKPAPVSHNLITAGKKLTLDSINKRTKVYNKEPSLANFNLVLSSVIKSGLDTLPKFKSLLKDTSTLANLDTSFLPSTIDSIPISPDSTSSVALGVCPNLETVKNIKYLLSENDNYIGILEDVQGNALGSFVITQLNKELFYDKLRKTMMSLCDNKDTIDKVINAYQLPENDLYTAFLEAVKNLDNPNELAGTLFIHRTVFVHSSEQRVIRNTQTIKRFPIFSSVAQAKIASQKAIRIAERLKIQLDSLSNVSRRYEGGNKNEVLVQHIRKMAMTVDETVALAKTYLDSISSKIPDQKILYYYNKAIQLSQKAVDAVNEAKEEIKNAIELIETLRKGSSAETKLMPFQFASIFQNIPQHNNNVLLSLKPLANNTLTSSLPLENLQNSTTSFDSTGSGKFSLQGIPDFVVQEVQIQFQNGFIENIKVFGKFRDSVHLFRFENYFPIGFSTKRDFRNLVDISLFEKSDYHRNRNLFINLGELISYNQQLANDNKDYSPANQVLTVKNLVDTIKEIPLYKEQTSRVLELQVFSDLKGADNNNPNGLIQFELRKPLNFFSWRKGATNKLFHKILPWEWKKKESDYIFNYGFFNYITPQFSLNKVENNQKRLVLNRIDTLSLAADTSKPITYTSTINLLKHQIYNVGFDCSIFLLDLPEIKSTINFGGGIRFGRTAIQDTFRTRNQIDSTHFLFNAASANNIIEYGINTLQWGPYVTWQLFPDSRFGINATQRFAWFKALSSNFVQVRDSANFLKFVKQTPNNDLRKISYPYSSRCIASTEIFAFLNLGNNTNNKLFFRYRLNWDVRNPKENFQQMQVGFSTFITATKEYKNLKKAAGLE